MARTILKRLSFNCYCTGQRSPHNNFFNRLPATPRRLDLSQDVLRTTECPSDRSGNARCILGRVVKSPAARARRTLFSTKIVRACTILVLACIYFKKFLAFGLGDRNRKSEKWVESRIEFCVQGTTHFSDFFFSKIPH